MKICILCSNTYAKHHRVFYKEAITFKKLNFKVCIIAPYNKKIENIEDITILDILQNPGYIYRILRNIMLLGKAFCNDADVYYTHELDSLFIGIMLKFLKRKPIIYLCREYYPEKQYYRRGRKFKLIGKILFYYSIKLYERLFYSFADAIVCVNNHMAHRFKKLGKPTFVIPNYPSLSFIENKTNSSIKLPPNTIIYIGGINDERNIKSLLRILAIIRNKFHCNANLAIYGNGEEKYLAEIRSLAVSLGISEHLILGKVPYKDIPALLSQAKIGIFLLKGDNIAHHWGEPVKFFEYAAAGLPVIISDLPAKRRLVEIFKNGYLVDPNNELLIAEKCVELLNNPQKAKKIGESGKKCFLEKFNWEANEQEIMKLFMSIKKKI